MYGCEDYEVSNTGMVRRLTTSMLSVRWPVGRHMTQQVNDSGYLRVKINGKYVFVHKIVAETFITPKVDDLQINHKNGCKTDNNVSNLEWVTLTEKMRHAIRTGLMKPVRGEKHGMSKLTEESVRDIRSVNCVAKIMAKKYNVDTSLINYVRQRKIWAHVE